MVIWLNKMPESTIPEQSNEYFYQQKRIWFGEDKVKFMYFVGKINTTLSDDYGKKVHPLPPSLPSPPSSPALSKQIPKPFFDAEIDEDRVATHSHY